MAGLAGLAGPGLAGLAGPGLAGLAGPCWARWLDLLGLGWAGWGGLGTDWGWPGPILLSGNYPGTIRDLRLAGLVGPGWALLGWLGWAGWLGRAGPGWAGWAGLAGPGVISFTFSGQTTKRLKNGLCYFI